MAVVDLQFALVLQQQGEFSKIIENLLNSGKVP